MKKSRFTEEQMVAILREADKAPVPGVAKKHKVSEQTIYTWRRRFGELQPADIRRLRQLETENAKLKKLVAERDRPTLEAMRRLAAQYPRYGYRRIRVFLRREGHCLSRHRAHRLWRLAALQLPRRRPRRRVAASRPRPLPATGPNHVWAYDFVIDACANGQQLKCLTVIDEFTRECLAIDVAGSIRSGRVIEVLARLISERGAPRYLRSDNGPEFVSRAILEWLAKEKIETALIDPGKPWQNGDNESFNGKFRDECLSLEWFRSRAEAKIVIETWPRHYNHIRPHQSLKDLTPIEFKTRYDAVNQGAVLQS
jgi:putative transposase